MSSLAETLSHTELLKDAPDFMLDMVLESATPLTLFAGDVLLSPGGNNYHVYLILSGVLAVHFDSLDSPEIRELTQGTSVGELSILDGTSPSAYVVAKVESQVFPIHCDLLHKLIADTNPVAANLLRLIIRWLKSNTRRIIQDRMYIEELSGYAKIDGLTGLYNRRWLNNALPRLLDQAINSVQPLCLMMIDVDHFKKYNDAHGHLGGDHALIAVGEVLRNTVRPYDFTTRYGGEEFMVILPNTSQDEGVMIAERIRQAIENKGIFSASGVMLPSVTISIGLAVSQSTSTPQSLIAAADVQLYRSKESGRNCTRIDAVKHA
ncbi:MAG: GGDEF domain-containing protein [Gallionella sp.]|nr:GGDEF domain-containing protein [Gallionella sp.]MDD4959250.1 GGDEF domain-containing protein [Gallionella sp.]